MSKVHRERDQPAKSEEPPSLSSCLCIQGAPSFTWTNLTCPHFPTLYPSTCMALPVSVLRVPGFSFYPHTFHILVLYYLLHSFPHSLTHSITYSLTQSLTFHISSPSVTHPLAYPLSFLYFLLSFHIIRIIIHLYT